MYKSFVQIDSSRTVPLALDERTCKSKSEISTPILSQWQGKKLLYIPVTSPYSVHSSPSRQSLFETRPEEWAHYASSHPPVMSSAHERVSGLHCVFVYDRHARSCRVLPLSREAESRCHFLAAAAIGNFRPHKPCNLDPEADYPIRPPRDSLDRPEHPLLHKWCVKSAILYSLGLINMIALVPNFKVGVTVVLLQLGRVLISEHSNQLRRSACYTPPPSLPEPHYSEVWFQINSGSKVLVCTSNAQAVRRDAQFEAIFTRRFWAIS